MQKYGLISHRNLLSGINQMQKIIHPTLKLTKEREREEVKFKPVEVKRVIDF